MKKPTPNGRWWLSHSCKCGECDTYHRHERFAEWNERVGPPKCPKCGGTMCWDTGEELPWVWVDGELVVTKECSA